MWGTTKKQAPSLSVRGVCDEAIQNQKGDPAMKIEEAIAILERKTTIPNDGYTWEQVEQAIDAAITALHFMQEILAPADCGLPIQSFTPEAGEPIDFPPTHIDRSKWKPCDNCKKACWNCKHNLFCGENNDEECYNCVNQSKWEHGGYQQYCSRCGYPLTEAAWAELERRLRE